MKQLQDEFALESVTNIEFEESSRRSFEFLTGQVKSLKEAFTTLSDTLLEEIEHLANSIRGEIFRIEDRCQKTETAMMGSLTTGEKLGRQVEQLAKDLDAVLGVVPKIEDSMLRSSAHVQERLDRVVHDVGKVSEDVGKACGDVEYLQSKVRTVESELRQELEQKSLKLQRSVTLQLESMSRALIRESDRPSALGSALPGSGGVPFSSQLGAAAGASSAPFSSQLGAAGGAVGSALPSGPGAPFSSQLPGSGPAGPPFSANLPTPGGGQAAWAAGGSFAQSPSQPSFGGGYNDGGSPHRRAQNTSQHNISAQVDSPGHLKAYVPVDIDLTGLESPSLRTSRML